VPNLNDHIERAEANESFARSLDQSQPFYVDWAITILFYAALHYIDAYLAVKSFHPANHPVRDNAIDNNGSLKPIFNDYRRLKDVSEAARYGIAQF
jgi:hypothetical protein